MLSKIIEFVKEYQADIILVIGVILISLLSFAAGFIAANKQQEKEPIKIEKSTNSEFFTNERIRKFVADSLFADL